MKRLFCLLLAGILLLGCFAGCKKKDKTKPQNTDNTESKESVLPDKDWDGNDLKVFINQNELVGDIIQNDDITDPIGNEVYRRNSYLEQKYNFFITCKQMTNSECPARRAQNEALRGESTFDLILDSVTDMKGALAQFVFADLADLEYIDWDAKGGLKEANDSLDILGYRYICTGDANLYEKSGAILMYYNRTIMNHITSEDVRQIALDGKWTMEKMYELIQLGAVKDSSSGEISIYGITHPNNEAFYNYLATGYGMQIITRDQDDNLSFAFDNSSVVDKTLQAIDDVLRFYCDADTTYNQRWLQSTPKADNIFLENRSLFQPNMLSKIKTWKEGGIDYGFLPLPKANEETEKYRSAYYTTDTEFFAIPFYAADKDFSAFALQAMMENSSELTHVYVEEQCKLKGSYDSVDYDLITLALSNFVYDLGAIFNWGAIHTWIFVDRYEHLEPSGNPIKSIPTSGENNLVTSWAEKKKLAHQELNDFLARFQ